MKKRLLLFLAAVFLFIPSSLFAENIDDFWDVNETRKDLEISIHEVTLTAIGEQFQLEANLEGNGSGINETLLWTVKDESVCTVDETGLLTAVGKGKTDVMVYTKDQNHKNICHVTVEPKLTGISISPDSFTLRGEGSSVQLEVMATPNNAFIGDVEWTTSDPSVCVVDKNGKVTSVGGGTAEITATEKNSKLVAVSNITVDIPLRGISLSENYLVLDKGESVKLVANLIPSNTVYKNIRWLVTDFSSYDSLPCSLYDDGVIIADRAGFCVVEAYVRVGDRFVYADRCYIFVRPDSSDPEETMFWNCGADGDNVVAEFNTRTGVLKISGEGAMHDYYGSNEYTPWYSQKDMIQSVIIEPGVSTIGAFSFWECSSVRSISIPSSVHRIGPHAMNGCVMLESIDIPDSVTDIQEFVFCNCFNLKSIDFPENVTEIDTGLFENCEKITEIKISKNVTSIIDEAFVNCRNLEQIEVDSNNSHYTSIDGVLFTLDKSELVAYPGGKKDKNYIVPENTKIIQDAAFSCCEYLENVVVPDSVTSLGVRVFSGSQNIRSIKLSDNISAIKDSAFSGCKRLESVNIPEKTAYIGNYVFIDCYALKSLEFPKNLIGIGNSGLVFSENYCLESISVDDENLYFSSDEYGVLYNKDKTELILYPSALDYSEYKMPSSVKKISDSSFADNSYLLGIEIEDEDVSLSSISSSKVTGEIGDEAFLYSLNLESVTVSDQISYIGDLSFGYCSNLETIVIPENVSYISNSAFSGSDNVTIYGEYGSYAESYAKEQGIPFKDASLVKPVTNISFNVSRIDFSTGGSFAISANIAPENAGNKTLTWKSDNSAVASVKNGVVSALKPGIAVVTASSADGKVTESCTVIVRQECSAFSDVPAGKWYYDYVYDLAELGIINGMTKTTFVPNGLITRAQFAKILAAASGENISAYAGKTSFSDVSPSAWYASYVQWAYEKGIVKGISNTTFAPEDNITREQMAAMICRYAAYKKVTLPQTNAKLTFKDDKAISNWAKSDVYAMQQAGIINGYADGSGYIFKPKGNATRAEAATMVSIFLAQCQ